MNVGKPADLHTFGLVVRDQPGVLVRIALVFSRRGFNIESLAVSPSRLPGFARMTVLSRGVPETVEQITKQLAKLIDVVFVTEHQGETPVETECALIKLRWQGAAERASLLSIAARFEARAVEESEDRAVLVAHGTSSELDALLAELPEAHLEELVRSGKIVMSRGASQFAHLLGPERT
jgi:acetolactate synthase-1/3 small subunit